MEGKWKRWRWPWVAVALLAIYLLGIGPAVRYVRRGALDPLIWYDMIYRPVLWCADQSETLTTVLEWYVDLWTFDEDFKC